MKKLFSLLLIAIPFCSLWAEESKEVSSTITDVTVYLRGAQVTREANINLPKGSSSIIFRELPVQINPQSIQLKGAGNFIILSIAHQINYLSQGKKSREVKMLQDSLKIYEDQSDLLDGLLQVLKSEEDMLQDNRDISSSEKGVVLAELKLSVEYYRTRLTEIKKEQIRLNRESKKVKEKLNRIQNQIESLNAKENQPTSEIYATISADAAVSGKLILSYTVLNAGWTPIYDIRASDVQSPVRLFYNANVIQNTGEDWNQVHIRLSTANPEQQGEKPDLQPWFIDFPQLFAPEPAAMYNTIRSVSKKELMVAEDKMVEEEAYASPTVAQYTDVNENQTNMEFVIRLPYDIPSDGKEYTMNIQDYSLPALFEYYCAPKLDREAFLIARITGWENYNLLSGDMNLFFEDTYVGKSRLNVRNTNDTLDVSLGRDKSIIVTRVKLKDFTETRTIGSNKRETRAWEISIRNNKKQKLQLRLEDQLPVSMNKDIEVEPLDYSGGKLQKETGIITWKLQIDPAAEKKLKVSYAVKYPKDKQVYIE